MISVCLLPRKNSDGGHAVADTRVDAGYLMSAKEPHVASESFDSAQSKNWPAIQRIKNDATAIVSRLPASDYRSRIRRATEGQQMQSLPFTLEFDDVNTCVGVMKEVLAKGGEDERFSVSGGTDTLNMDSQYYTLLLSFMENGGLEAVTGFIVLLRDVIKALSPEKKVTLKYGDKSMEIVGGLRDEKVVEIARALLAAK